MGVTLIVTRMGRGRGEADRGISLDEWLAMVAGDEELRIREGNWELLNPKTGEKISVPVLPGQTEFSHGGEWEPFLGLSDSELVMGYRLDFEDSENPTRRKIAQVARKLGAVIATDASDEILDW